MEKSASNNTSLPMALKILIVDDEIDICYLLSGILRQKNYKSSYVNTLSDTELALKKESFSLIFLDNHLPDGLGVDFISYAKKYYPDTRVVMITANDTAADREKAYAEGVDYFMSKPFTRDMVYEVISLVAGEMDHKKV